MKALITEGAFGSAFIVITGAMSGSIFLIAFMRKLGASELQIGILSAIPQIASMFQVLASYLLEKYGGRKKFCIISSALGKVFWLIFILIPFYIPNIGTNTRVLWSLLFVFLANVSMFFSNTSYISWVSDFIPNAIRGRLFAKKTVVAAVVVLFIPMLMGIYLDRYDSLANYAQIFAVGLVLGGIASLILVRVPEVPMHKELATNFWDVLRIPFREVNFRYYVIFNFLWAASSMLFIPFTQILLLENLSCSKSYIGFMVLLNGISNILFTWIFGYLSDKFSRKPFLIICAFVLTFAPLVWIFVTPSNYNAILIPFYIISGVFWAGLNISVFTLLLSLVPDAGKSKYYALFYITVGLGGAVAPIAGGLILKYISVVAIGSLIVSNYQLIFFIGFLIRIIAMGVVFKVHEPAEVSTGYVLKQFRMTNPFKVFINLFLFSSNVSETKKAAIVRKLGETRSPLVVDELMASLDDTSSEVRKEAIRALGHVGDRRVVDLLLDRLNDQSKEVQELAVDALGELKDERSINSLLEKLDSEDSKIRSIATEALGKIGNYRAVEKIREVLRQDTNLEVVTSSAKALSRIGEIQAIWEILPILRKTDEGPIRRELATAVGNLLGKHGEFYSLLKEEEELMGSGCSRMLDEYFKDVRIPIGKTHTLIMERDKVISMIIASYNDAQVAETLVLLNALNQRILYQSLQMIATKQGWPQSLRQEIVFAGHIQKSEKLEGIDYRLSTNAWLIYHLADDVKELSKTEVLLAFYALRNLGKRLYKLYKREE